MKKYSSLLSLLLVMMMAEVISAQQPSPVQKLFPQGTITYSNIS